jgi:DNA-binding Lrp family transcriptional regulator
LEEVKSNPGLSLKELSRLLEVSQNTLKNIVYKLKSEGYIEKAGDGYVITPRGERFLNFLEKRRTTSLGEEVGEKEPEERVAKEEPTPSTRTQSIARSEQELLSNIVNKLRELEKRVSMLEAQMKNLELAIASSRHKREGVITIDPPIQPINEAISKYGSLIDKLINENKLVRVGSLVVDASIYQEFKSRFPIKTSDIDKLNPLERQLLEEMRREAIVILHAGKEYRLVG